ncbi:MAG: endonuclease [Paludibacteraceae bacterium]
MRKFYFIPVFILLSFVSIGQEPTNYYSVAEGKTNATLKSTLYGIISSNYKTNSYDYLYTIYETSDKTTSGNVWDMYSTCTWNFGQKQCGNYSGICDCFNREHSVPQSWFNSNSPMVSDAFHIYPTDGKVNGIRSNYPFGETNALPIGGKGLGKLGTSSFPGYTGTVFEPVDEYKGDFARSYFYFATRYENIMTTIDGASFNQTVYPALSDWSVNLFLKWHRQDPVSQKERDRNNAIYVHQRNRNPFIDHPELAEYIWGNKMGTAWTISGSTNPILTSPISGTTVDFGTVTYQQNLIKTVPVSAANLTGDLTVTLSGASASYFSIPTTIPKADAEAGFEITIYYYAPETGTHNATLTISGGGVSDVTVNITAIAVSCVDFSFSAPFTSDMVPFSQYSVLGDQVWSWRSANYGVAMSGYEYATNHANEDWLITNEMDLSDYENVRLEFSHTINKGIVANMQTENTVWISNDFHYGDPADATWTQLTIPTYPTGNDWTFVESGNIAIPAENCKSNTFIGFKYVSTASASSTWEIKNLSITGKCETNTGNIEVVKKKHAITLADKQITIFNLRNEGVQLYDIYGRLIHQMTDQTADHISLKVPASGIYIVRIGNEINKVLIK